MTDHVTQKDPTCLKPESGQWVVVQTSASLTKSLCEYLQSKGMVAWVPLWKRKVRLPRRRAKVEIEIPVLPSYVFVDQDALDMLFELKATFRLKGSVLVMHGDVVRIRDADLEELRKIVDMSPSEAKKFIPRIGDRRIIREGVFAGLACRVTGLTSSHAIVEFEKEGWRQIHLPYFLFRTSTI